MCSILSSVFTSPHKDKKASLSKSKRYCSDTLVGYDKSPPQIICANFFDIKKVLISDNTVDQYESNLMRRICGLIYFSDKDCAEIKLNLLNSK